MGWVPAFSRLSPGIPLFARPPDLTCRSGGRVAFRHRSFPAPPLLGGCRAAEARFPSVEADLQARSRSVANLQPRGCIPVSARLQKTTRAGTGFHPGRYAPASVRVRLCIRADASLHPCGCDFSSGQIRPSVRADATFHPGRYEPASGRVRFYSPSDTRKHPQGCLGASLRV